MMYVQELCDLDSSEGPANRLATQRTYFLRLVRVIFTNTPLRFGLAIFAALAGLLDVGVQVVS